MWADLGQTYAIDKNVLFKYMGSKFTDLSSCPIADFIALDKKKETHGSARSILSRYYYR